MSELYIKATRGLSTDLAKTNIVNGTFLITTDTQKMYVDIDNVRIPLSDIVTGNTAAQIKAIASADAKAKLYLASDTNDLYWYDTTNSAWAKVGNSAEFAEKDASGNVITTTYKTVADAATDFTTLSGRIDNLQTAIGNINSFEIAVVDDIESLPATGQSGYIYFVKDITSGQNKYDEYIWVAEYTPESGDPVAAHYENIGSSEAKFDNYYLKTEVQAFLGIDSTGAVTAVSNDGSVYGAILKEVADRTAADTTLQNNIEAEAASRSAVDITLTNKAAKDLAILGTYDKTVTETTDPQTGVITYTVGQGDTLTERLSALENDTAGAEALAQETEDREAADLVLSNTDARNAAILGTYDKTVTETVDQETGVATYTVAQGNTITERLASLETAKSFERVIYDSLDSIPESAKNDHTIYLIPEDGLTGDYKDYAEYLWVAEYTYTDAEEQEVTILAGFQRIDSTVDFLNYYTKAEINSTVGTINSTIASNAAAESSHNISSQEADARVNAIIGTYDKTVTETEVADGVNTYAVAQGDTLTERLAALENDTAGAEALAQETEDREAADLVLSNVDARNAAILGTYDKTVTETVDQETGVATYTVAQGDTLTERLASLESDVSDITSDTASEAATRAAVDTTLTNKAAKDLAILGTYDKAVSETTDPATGLITYTVAQGDTLTERLVQAESDISDLETADETEATARAAADLALSNADARNAAIIGTYDKTVTESVDQQTGVATYTVAQGNTITERLATLESSVTSMTHFTVSIVETLPVTGEEYVIYFVPDTAGSTPNVYAEYIWVTEFTKEDSTVVAAHFEQIGSTATDLSNYYTKTQIDTKENALKSVDNRVNTIIGTYDKALTETVDQQTGVITYSVTTGNSITERLSSLETYTGSVDDQDPSTTSLAERISDLENDTADADAVDLINAKIGNYDNHVTVNQVTGEVTVNNGETIEERLNAITDEIGTSSDTSTDSTVYGAIAAEAGARDTADQAINDEIDTYAGSDWLFAGSSTNKGAALKVDQAATTDNEEQPVLVKGSTTGDVEYSSGVTINPSTNAITVTAIKLGAATITYDASTESVVVNF